MIRSRPAIPIAIAAFILGVIVTLLIAPSFSNTSKSEERASVLAATTTPAVARTEAPSPSSTPNMAPTLVIVPLQPSIPAQPQATPLAGASLQVQPGACTQASASDYISQALPPLQQLGGLYDGWSHAPITTSSAQMHSLQQILGNFIQSFDTISPVLDGCAFVHGQVLQAAKDLTDVAGRVDFNNTPALHPGWEAEYRGRATNMQNAINLYVSATGITLTPRPFADISDRALP